MTKAAALSFPGKDQAFGDFGLEDGLHLGIGFGVREVRHKERDALAQRVPRIHSRIFRVFVLDR